MILSFLADALQQGSEDAENFLPGGQYDLFPLTQCIKVQGSPFVTIHVSSVHTKVDMLSYQ